MTFDPLIFPEHPLNDKPTFDSLVFPPHPLAPVKNPDNVQPFNFREAVEPHAPEFSRSRVQEIIDQIMVSVENARQQIFLHLTRDPGVASTLGDDFLIEFGDFEIVPDGPIDDLNAYNFKIVQPYKIHRNTTD